MWMIVSIFSSLSSISPPPPFHQGHLVPGTIKRIHFNFFIQCTNMFLNPLYKYQPVWILIFSFLFIYLFIFAKHLCLNFEPHSNTLALESTVWTKRYSAFTIQHSAFANISQYYKKKSVKIYLTQLFGPKSPNYLKRHRWNWIAHG